MSRWLWTAGSILVALGLAAHVFGWDALLWVPEAVADAVRSSPETYGLVAAGLALMVLARLVGRRRN